MELDLSPKLAKKVYGGDGGSYYAWCPTELPMLRQGNIGAAKARDVDDDTAKALIGNQQGKGIVKLDANVKMPEPKPDHRKGMALNCWKEMRCVPQGFPVIQHYRLPTLSRAAVVSKVPAETEKLFRSKRTNDAIFFPPPPPPPQ
ncbi:hypothetical protein V6N13_001032 [Hibiscus sabdariffa]